jgi:hypothetical protein
VGDLGTSFSRHKKRDKPTAHSAQRRGELVELAFSQKAVILGFGVAKPYGDSECYDFILDSREHSGRKLWRVQVKSSAYNSKGAYHVSAGHFTTRYTKQPYTPEQIDFLVVCIVPEDAWYVIPVREFTPRRIFIFLSTQPGQPRSI